ncbi:MAG: DNA polymerase III subunit gamma/tau [bacterium]
MSYLVFARKWRPQTFEEVVGQGVVTQTLMNALSANRIAHAYLFAGPRGVGKTSTARILAKALNCEAGISQEPCNACPSCQDIAQGRHLDVIEIDGASNRGIDEIRELRENVRFSPYRGRYKVIVIDEVHMLTEPAFNALLKTLEEPPPKVVFVLATTEPHKIPTTILSRCQRFEFRRISSPEIAQRLQEMAREEGIEIDPESVQMITRSAEGSLRDAQSLLDQVVSYSGPRVRAEDVVTILGVVDRQKVEEAARHLLTGEGSALLQLVEDLCSAGHDLRLFCMGLLELVRDLMVIQVTSSPGALVTASAGSSDFLREGASKWTFPELDRLLQILIQAEIEMRRSPYPRFILEMALLRAVEGRKLTSLEDIWKRLCQMEEALTFRSARPEGEMTPGRPASAPPARPASPAEAGDSQGGRAAEGKVGPEGASRNWLEDPGWMELKRIVKREKVSLAPLLEYFTSACLQGRVLTVLVEGVNSYLSETLEDRANQAILERAVRDAFGQELRIRFEFGKREGERREASPVTAPADPGVAEPQAPGANSLVEKALEVFEGRVVERR